MVQIFIIIATWFLILNFNYKLLRIGSWNSRFENSNLQTLKLISKLTNL